MPRFRLDHTVLLQVYASSKVISEISVTLGKAKLKQRSVSFINGAQIQTIEKKNKQINKQTNKSYFKERKRKRE